MKSLMFQLLVLSCLGASGCGPKPADTPAGPSGTSSTQPAPTFSLAWSEYPSWSVFGVAHELGLINGAAGELGTLETKYGVDIDLREAGYDSCLNMYTSGDCDAVCMTNMDALIVSPQRAAVAVLPTSTSNGADALLVTEAIPDLAALKQYPVFGLANSVSQYCFARCLEVKGLDEKDFTFTNLEPSTAAINMQQRSADHQAIMVWNPFVLQTLRNRSDVRVLFDSTEIPGEIVDMVVIGGDSLAKPKAAEFLQAVSAAFYAVNQAIADPAEGDEVLVALGRKFADLQLDDMKLVVKQTQFYQTPAEARALLTGDEFKATMKTVEDFCVKHGLAENPSVGYGPAAGEVKLRFDASYLSE